jgi:hypothetical protein
MKSFAWIFAALFLFQPRAAAQDDSSFELKKVKADMGKGSVTSGYDVAIQFQKSITSFSVIGNHQRVYVALGNDYGWLNVTATGGFFKNCPWAGPRVMVRPFSWFSIMAWYGFAAGEPEQPDWKINQIIVYHCATIQIWKFSASCATNKFLHDKTNYYPGISFVGDLNHKWQYKISTDYDVNNKEPLFLIGLTYIVE